MMNRREAYYWQRWRFYPGAVTFLIPRLIFSLVDALFLYIVVKILLIGVNKNEPIPPGWRKKALRWSY